VIRVITTQITLDAVSLVKYTADINDFIIRQDVGFLLWGDSRLRENFQGRRSTDAKDIGEPDFDSLVARQLDSCNARHSLSSTCSQKQG
jgi:hypothetical protein